MEGGRESGLFLTGLHPQLCDSLQSTAQLLPNKAAMHPDAMFSTVYLQKLVIVVGDLPNLFSRQSLDQFINDSNYYC